MSICLLPPCVQSKELQTYVAQLINLGYSTYYKLPIQYKEKIVSLIIKYLGADAFEILLDENDIKNTVDYFSDYLISESKNDALDLVEHMKQNALKHYEYEINELFEELNWRKAS